MTSLFLEYETGRNFLEAARNLIGKKYYWSKRYNGEKIPHKIDNEFTIISCTKVKNEVYLGYRYNSGLESDERYQIIMNEASPVDTL